MRTRRCWILPRRDKDVRTLPLVERIRWSRQSVVNFNHHGVAEAGGAFCVIVTFNSLIERLPGLLIDRYPPIRSRPVLPWADVASERLRWVERGPLAGAKRQGSSNAAACERAMRPSRFSAKTAGRAALPRDLEQASSRIPPFGPGRGIWRLPSAGRG